MAPGEDVVKHQKGSTMAVTLMIMAVLILSLTMAMNIVVENSGMMKNSRGYRDDLYRAETGLTLAVETQAESWLAADSVLFDLSRDDAEMVVDGFSITDADGREMPVMGRYTIARIESEAAEDSPSKAFYPLGHQAPIPSGSGYSAMKFEIRRYGIRSTGASRPKNTADGVTVEAGLYKVFNIF